MAGGEGAKERRRLKRSNGSDDATVEASLGRTSKESSVDRRRGTSKDDRRKKESKGGQSFPGQRRDFGRQKQSSVNSIRRPQNPANGSPNVTKKQSKKPKHLKRKLEHASQDDNEQTREALRIKIQEWEERKAELSNRSKRQKRVQPTNGTGRESGNVALVDDEKDGPVHFKRNNPPKEDERKGKQDHVVSGASHKSKSKGNAPMNDRTESCAMIDDETDGTSHHKNSEIDTTKEIIIKVAAIAKKDAETSLKKSVHELSDDGSNPVNDNSDDDDDCGGEMEDGMARRGQRGRRRRGRKDTAKNIEEMQTEKRETSSLKIHRDGMTDGGPGEGTAPCGVSTSLSSQDHSTDKEGEARYCVGRKPVTDFILGQSYPAKVVYVKPFGVFLDIGCHSDAFCHVSRLSDEFVDSPDVLFKEGDHVPKARVVEIDRRHKRITVSLQSEIRIQDERASIEARRSRNETRKLKLTSKVGRSLLPPRNDRIPNGSAATKQVFEKNEEQHPGDSEQSFARTREIPQRRTPAMGDPSFMSPAELKRARKLSRRAARREQAN